MAAELIAVARDRVRVSLRWQKSAAIIPDQRSLLTAPMTIVPTTRTLRACRTLLGLAVCAVLSAWSILPAVAQRIDNTVAVFAALDKVTATIKTLEVELGKTEVYGSLRVTPRVCYSRAPTDPPKTSTFVEVDEVGLDGKKARLFSGWMFAESPGLNAVEHPVFDVWLTGCKGGSENQASAPGAAGNEDAGQREPDRRRRVRR